MTLWVHAYCGYPIFDAGVAKTQDDFDALTIVHAIKGQPLKTRFAKRNDAQGVRLTVEAGKEANAFRLFGTWGRNRLAEIRLSSPPLFVPIPASTCVEPQSDVKGAKLAGALHSRCAGSSMAMALHWKAPMQSARSGGPRDPTVLLANLAGGSGLPRGARSY